MRFVREHEDAADVAQKAFVKAFLSIDTFKGESSFKTWLFRITINLSKNHLRDNRPSLSLPLEERTHMTNPDMEGALSRKKMRNALRRAVETLPAKQRQTVILRIYKEASFKEIAQALACSEGSAKVNFHHAMKKLKGLLTPTFGGESVPMAEPEGGRT